MGPAVALLGPGQCGKTTLARQLAEGSKSTYFDLENPVDLARLSEPMTALDGGIKAGRDAGYPVET